MSSHTERDLPSSIGPTDVSPLTRVDTRSLSDRTFSEPARVPNRAATHIGGADLVGRDDDETTPAVVGRVTASEDQAVFGMADTVSKDGPSDSSEDLAPDPDPVADATMAKILSSHSTTRLGKKSSSRENAAAVREDPDAANAGVKPGCHPDRRFGIDPEIGGAVLGSRINQPGYKTTNQKDTQTSPGAKTNANSLESTPPGGGGFSRRLQRFATLGRAFFPSSTPPSDDDGKPPIRLRRTSSYYGFANDRRHDWSPKKETNFTNPCGAFTNKKHDATECGEDDFLRERRVLARRRDELATFRGRVAGSGKLIASALAGLLAGVVLWAMTTVTAQLTALKFDYTKTLLTLRVEEPGVNAANGGSDGRSEAHNLFTAWAFYAGCAALAIGVTAAYVLHPHGAPMSRGSGIPELKGYLNGNRQQGLFHWRTFLGRSVGICLVITATMPFGREGPSVHIGACAASAVLNLVPWRSRCGAFPLTTFRLCDCPYTTDTFCFTIRLGWQPSPEERRQILQLGSAAGVAAAFNAPIGGLLYVMEEVASSLPHDYVWRAMLAAGTAVGSAQILYTVNEGRVDYSSLVITDPDSSTGWSPSDLPLIILLAIIAGAFSALFTLVADFFGGLRRKGAEEEENDNDESMNGRKEPTFLKKLKRRVKNMYHSRLGAWCDAVVGAVLVATAQVALPTLFPCRPAPEMVSGTAYNGRRLLGEDFGDDVGQAGLGTYSPARFGDESHEERNSGFLAGHGRSLLSSAVYIPRTFVQYTCRDGDFNEMATLMLQNEEGVVKHLFARDDMYRYGLIRVSQITRRAVSAAPGLSPPR
jgi:H+/Cl- antiporter ClcA